MDGDSAWWRRCRQRHAGVPGGGRSHDRVDHRTAAGVYDLHELRQQERTDTLRCVDLTGLAARRQGNDLGHGDLVGDKMINELGFPGNLLGRPATVVIELQHISLLPRPHLIDLVDERSHQQALVDVEPIVASDQICDGCRGRQGSEDRDHL